MATFCSNFLLVHYSNDVRQGRPNVPREIDACKRTMAGLTTVVEKRRDDVAAIAQAQHAGQDLIHRLRQPLV